MKNYESIVQTILATPNDLLSWRNLVQPFIDLDNESVDFALLNMKDFYPDETIRENASELANELGKWEIEQIMRRDIYSKYQHYYLNQWKTESEKLTGEQNSFIQDMMIDYKIIGMDLTEDKFNKLKEIKKTISDLCSEFNQNLGNENYSENISKDELIGLPDDFINSRLQPDSTVKITLKYPDIVPIMEYCKNRELRKRMCMLFKSRCIKENTPLVSQTYKLRAEIADIFEVANYSDYKLSKSMAGSTQTVNNFLTDLLNKVKPLLLNDLDLLDKMAQQDNITKLELWDISYYSRIYVESTCDFNKEELKKYFPVSRVILGTFEIYQKLLGFNFIKLSDLTDTFWHDSVELYQVNDATSNNPVGYFYLDLYPRDGKYGHAACFPFITKSDKTLPVATMGCNFGKGTLTFDEVETFFHEFGHVMHHLSSESAIKDSASFSCEHDFVETPSQMFEEWCYFKESLELMSEQLPDEMVEKLNKSRKLLQGYHYARQLLFGHYDMYVHSAQFINDGLTPKMAFDKLQKSILLLDPIENTSEPASFGHLMGGYESGYYGYAWSLVYAKDLFEMFKEQGLLNPVLGAKLRKEVLAQGSMRKSMDSIKIFLGREPSNVSFINSICK
jgi:Zn-dependent oligopeptidase